MMDLFGDSNQLSNWLDLTEKEQIILKIVYRLQSENLDTTPENIVRYHKKIHKTEIQKPNLFHLLKKLRQTGFLKKEGYGKYQLDFTNIQEKLDKTGDKIEKNKKDLELFKRDLTGSFQRLAWSMTPPIVEYLHYESFFNKMADIAKDADTLSIVSNFPQITYSRTLTHALGREKYLEQLYKRTIRQKKLRLEYLTDLDIDYLFNHCFRVLEDPKKAYKESHKTIDTLEELVEKTPNLDIRFLSDPHGLDVAIKTKDETHEEFMLFIRDEHHDIMSGIRIKNPVITRNAATMFKRNYDYATKTTTKNGREQIQKTREKLTQKYGILED